MHSKPKTIGIVCAAAVVALAGTIVSAGGPTPVKMARVISRRHGPLRIHQQVQESAWESYNWSGYAVTGAAGAVTVVNGSWVVPAVNCSLTPNGYSSYWVGIDGFTSSTVEQTGTDSDCVNLNGTKNDTPTYYGWFEFYPYPGYLIEFPRIGPGDLMTAQVTYTGSTGAAGHHAGGSQFTVVLTDVTQGERFSTSSAVVSGQASSAEWIAEAPCCLANGNVLPLADFGTALFSNGNATVSKVAGPIGSFGANVQSITMVSEKAPNPTKARPGSLTNAGSNFSVAWFAAGP